MGGSGNHGLWVEEKKKKKQTVRQTASANRRVNAYLAAFFRSPPKAATLPLPLTDNNDTGGDFHKY